MLFLSLLSGSLLPGTALAASATSSASADLASLLRELKNAECQAAKAGRLVRRARTYGTSAAAKHKQAIFARRKERWAATVDQLEEEIESLGGQDSIASGSVDLSSFPTATAPAAATITSTTQAATTSATSSPSSSLKLKKGICFNEAELARNFDVNWGYGWSMKPDEPLKAGVEWVPMLWSDNVGDWMYEAPKQIAAGATHLLGCVDASSSYILAASPFNEPDLDQQANMTVAESVAAWKTYLSPFHGNAKLVSPAVTNGGYPMGVGYLSDFFGNCTQCYDETAAVALHWYDSATNIAYFKNYLSEAHERFNKPIWLTEFAGSGSVAQQQAFFDEVIPWMDDQDFIERYSAFGDFVGTFVKADASLTELGTAYNSA